MRLFPSLHLWDICALIAASRGVVGSSLHGRIVALAYGLPRVSLIPPQQGNRPDKRTAFAETWEPESCRAAWRPARSSTAVMQALAVPASVLRENATSLRARYLQSQAQWVEPAHAMNQAGQSLLRNNPETLHRPEPTPCRLLHCLPLISA